MSTHMYDSTWDDVRDVFNNVSRPGIYQAYRESEWPSLIIGTIAAFIAMC